MTVEYYYISTLKTQESPTASRKLYVMEKTHSNEGGSSSERDEGEFRMWVMVCGCVSGSHSQRSTLVRVDRSIIDNRLFLYEAFDVQQYVRQYMNGAGTIDKILQSPT